MFDVVGLLVLAVSRIHQMHGRNMVKRFSYTLTVGILLVVIESPAVSKTTKLSTVTGLQLKNTTKQQLNVKNDMLPTVNKEEGLLTINVTNSRSQAINFMKKRFMERLKLLNKNILNNNNETSNGKYRNLSSINDTTDLIIDQIKDIGKYSSLLNSPYFYDILKTDIRNIIKSRSDNYTKNNNNTPGDGFNVPTSQSYTLRSDNNKKSSNNNNNNNNNRNDAANQQVADEDYGDESPPFLRRFRTTDNQTRFEDNIKGSHNKNRREREKLNERDRHRHSKRVRLLRPVNYLLPPVGKNDFETFGADKEKEPLVKVYEQYKKLLSDRGISTTPGVYTHTLTLSSSTTPEAYTSPMTSPPPTVYTRTILTTSPGVNIRTLTTSPHLYTSAMSSTSTGKIMSSDEYILRTTTNTTNYNSDEKLEENNKNYGYDYSKENVTAEIELRERQLTQSENIMLPSFILNSPILSFTTEDHVFYVTPKFQQRKTINFTTTPVAVVTETTTSPNRNSTVSIENNDSQRFYSSVINNKSERTEDADDDRIIYKMTTNPISILIPDVTMTTAGWITSPSSGFIINNSNTSSYLNYDNTGSRNLTIVNDKHSKHRNNYYLPISSKNVTTVLPTLEYKYTLPEIKSDVPIHEINSLITIKKENKHNRNNNAYDGFSYNINKLERVPLLSPDVKKAGMKVHKLERNSVYNDNKAHLSDNSGRDNRNSRYDINDTSYRESGVTSKTPVSHRRRNYYHSRRANNNERNDEYKISKKIMLGQYRSTGESRSRAAVDLSIGEKENGDQEEDNDGFFQLNVAETANLQGLSTVLRKTSNYKSHLDTRVYPQQDQHVIPGAPGEDYPTLSRPPLNSRFSCKNDHRRYIADTTTGCQVFFMCVGDGPGEAMLCPNGTLFSQDYLVCDWWYNVDCQQS